LLGAKRLHARVIWSDKRIVRGCKNFLFLFVKRNKIFKISCLVISRFVFIESLFIFRLYNKRIIVRLKRIKISLYYNLKISFIYFIYFILSVEFIGCHVTFSHVLWYNRHYELHMLRSAFISINKYDLNQLLIRFVIITNISFDL